MITDINTTLSPSIIQTSLPEGYLMRAPRMDELDAVVELINIAARPIIGRDKFTPEQYLGEWTTPGFNLETDARIVLDPDGKVVGYYEVWDLLNPPARVNCWGRTHPDYENLGIGSCLLEWAEQRAEQAIERAPDGSRVALQAHVMHVIQSAAKLYEDHGFENIRSSLRMVIEMEAEPPAPVWPDGIVMRSMRPGMDERRMIQAVRDAFQDHFGYVEIPFEDEMERWTHMMDADPDFDPTYFYLAWDGDEIAGMSLCWAKTFDDPDMAWVGTLGVLRPWRRRGLGLAMLHHTFGEFYRLGTRKMGLGVDAQSLTGATRLYTRAGMHPDPLHRHDLYEKVLRSGINLSTQTLDV